MTGLIPINSFLFHPPPVSMRCCNFAICWLLLFVIQYFLCRSRINPLIAIYVAAGHESVKLRKQKCPLLQEEISWCLYETLWIKRIKRLVHFPTRVVFRLFTKHGSVCQDGNGFRVATGDGMKTNSAWFARTICNSFLSNLPTRIKRLQLLERTNQKDWRTFFTSPLLPVLCSKSKVAWLLVLVVRAD